MEVIHSYASRVLAPQFVVSLMEFIECCKRQQLSPKLMVFASRKACTGTTTLLDLIREYLRPYQMWKPCMTTETFVQELKAGVDFTNRFITCHMTSINPMQRMAVLINKLSQMPRECYGNVILANYIPYDTLVHHRLAEYLIVLEFTRQIELIPGKHFSVEQSVAANRLIFHYANDHVKKLQKLHWIYARYKKRRIKRILQQQNLLIPPLHDVILSCYKYM